MTNLSLRGMDERVRKLLREEADQAGISMNALILKYIYKGIGYDPCNRPRYHDLDSLSGTWTELDGQKFLERIKDFEKIDQEIWK